MTLRVVLATNAYAANSRSILHRTMALQLPQHLTVLVGTTLVTRRVCCHSSPTFLGTKRQATMNATQVDYEYQHHKSNE